MRLRTWLCTLLFAATTATAADSVQYPTRPIRLIVPQTPGGATDLVGRIIASMLSERFGVPIIVDNRAGSATIAGSDIVAKSIPDGYTLLVAAAAFAILPAMEKKLPFDPIKDFAGIMTLSTYPNVVMVNAALPVNSMKEFIAYAKARPGKLNYSSGGVGSATHIGVELFKSMAGIDLVHVTYKGGAPALTALIAGEVQMYFTPLPVALPVINNNKLKPLVVTSAKPSALVPNLPTLSDSGVPGFEQTTWNGLVAPVRTPREIVRKLYVETAALMKSPTLRERYTPNGLEPGVVGADDFTAMIKAENAKWTRVIRQAGINPE